MPITSDPVLANLDLTFLSTVGEWLTLAVEGQSLLTLQPPNLFRGACDLLEVRNFSENKSRESIQKQFTV